jgi:hypothetical protein
MINCWDKDGNEVNMPYDEGDDDMGDITGGLTMLFAVLSQKSKTIITKVQIEDDNMIMTLEQK